MSTEHPVTWNAPAGTADESSASERFCFTNNVFCTVNTRGSMQGHLNVLTRQLGLLSGVEVTRTPTSRGYVWTVTFQDAVNGLAVAKTSATLNDGAGTGDVAINTLATGATFAQCVGTHLITGLTQGQTYFARVFAYNAIGYSLAAAAPASVKPVRVPQPPIGVSVSVISGTSLRVVWSPNDDGGDQVRSYTIQYDTSPSFTSANLGTRSFNYLNAGLYSLVISGLNNGVYYYFRVAAVNSQGLSAWETSSPVSQKPMQVPSAPTGVSLQITSQSALTVSFDAPVNTGGDAITYFRVEWDVASNFASNFELPFKGVDDVPASSYRSYTIGSLQTNINTYVRVTARNAIGFVQMATPLARAPVQQESAFHTNTMALS